MIQETKEKVKKWKYPGGLMDPGETIQDAVRREVLEESGVHAKFTGILGMREQTNYKNGASDFYLVCLLVPENEDDIQPNI
mmetsp:Transcript_19637/g.18716  ORF Transcript_19637/g.18716 Transcript_19637/m.18716 type:complete len:81 (-) Transcript_19637:320-562(-)|eukprot:CAMPEP_0170547860 /NCGR_PEP_ID=MMETSP0211-20121228/6172_1 /TAXON_ID=311385 /ORGANISM="Pseudokeronopsis sp., Strain OXSARD2" /LENGTH=80 /DNA_ID=CAMNT_0010853063 /DNA_START=170 /DNA_END=412 /DNA_ORIENTATION=+